MMYMIEILPKYGSSYQIISGREHLFDVLWIIDKSPSVYQFKVSQGSMTNNFPREFGWGNFDKWVNKFTFEREK